MFCPKHNEVGCIVCMTQSHSSCGDKQFISDVASGIKTSKELKQLEKELGTLQTKLKYIEKLKRGHRQRLQQSKEDLIKERKTVIKKMNDQIDQMENALAVDTEEIFTEKIDAINNRIEEVETILGTLKQATQNLKGQHSDVDIFVTCKTMIRKMSTEYHPMLHRLDQRLPEVHFDLQIVEDMRLIIEGKQVLATIKESLSITEATYEMEFTITVDKDKKMGGAIDICSLSDGCLVLADYFNKALKKYDPVSGDVSTLIRVPGKPSGVCLVDNTRLAVSLYNMKKVQFVSVASRIALASSFSVGGRCNCLAHWDGVLYVCCGGSKKPGLKDVNGYLEVYNCNGEPLKLFLEEMVFPNYIFVVKDGNSISIVTSDYYKGVMIRGPDIAVRHRMDTGINTLLPFCMLDTDTFCIGEYETKSIYVQTVSDKRILIEPRNLKGNPMCLCYDKPSSRLYVNVECNNGDEIVQVFKLI